jgi:transcriptional regulator with GAF, ATPase, and Fis domain
MLGGDNTAKPASWRSTDIRHRSDAAGQRAFFLGRESRDHGGDAALVLRTLVSKLVARLGAVSAAAIDDEVTAGLGLIADALRLDVAMLWSRAEPGDRPSHAWLRQANLTVLQPAELASLRVLRSRLAAGEPACFAGLEHWPDPQDRERLHRHGIRSAAFVPFRIAGSGEHPAGALALWSVSFEHEWTAGVLDQLGILAALFGHVLGRKELNANLQRMRVELQELRQRTTGNPPSRPRGPIVSRNAHAIVAKSAAVQRALAQAEHVAATASTVLLLGETGVGKEVFAEAIHALSARGQRHMVRVSCAAIPETLIESELFGRERGAYTGAVTRQIGRFEAANHSTIFLDEIGELPLDVQVKLLRVLQERVIERLGSTTSINVDVRIIAATNRNLEKAIEEKTFREDLFYRLNVFPIVIPPLRERVEDIPDLVWTLVDEVAASLGKTFDTIPSGSMLRLQQYPWPGNVRQLRNVIERAVIIADGPRLDIDLPAIDTGPAVTPARTLRELEIGHIRATLEGTRWRIRGRGGAAERLGIKPTTLETRMAKLGLVRPNRGSIS